MKLNCPVREKYDTVRLRPPLRWKFSSCDFISSRIETPFPETPPPSSQPYADLPLFDLSSCLMSTSQSHFDHLDYFKVGILSPLDPSAYLDIECFL